MAKNTQTFNGDIAFVNAEASGNIKAENITAEQVLLKGLVFTLNQSEDAYYVGAEAGATFGEEVILPDYYNGLPVVEVIANGFSGHTEIKRIHIPKYTQFVSGAAFNGCTGLVEIELPDTVVGLTAQAFLNCSALEKVTCKATTPPFLGTEVFKGLPNTAKLYVPAESVTNYKSNANWTTADRGFSSSNILSIQLIGTAERATKAYCDENGDDIVDNYAKKNGTYANMTVGAAVNATNTAFSNATWSELIPNVGTGYATLPSKGTYHVQYDTTATRYDLGIYTFANKKVVGGFGEITATVNYIYTLEYDKDNVAIVLKKSDGNSITTLTSGTFFVQKIQ